MPSEHDDPAFAGKMVFAAISAVVPEAQLISKGPAFRIGRSYPLFGSRVTVFLTLADDPPTQSPRWTLGVADGDSPVFTNLESAVAIMSFIWADRMLCTRFAELQRLLNTGVIPLCVSNCGDLHNFLDWNMAGDAEELIEAVTRSALMPPRARWTGHARFSMPWMA